MHLLRWIQRPTSACPWRDFAWRMKVGLAFTIVIVLAGVILRA